MATFTHAFIHTKNSINYDHSNLNICVCAGPAAELSRDYVYLLEGNRTKYHIHAVSLSQDDAARYDDHVLSTHSPFFPPNITSNVNKIRHIAGKLLKFSYLYFPLVDLAYFLIWAHCIPFSIFGDWGMNCGPGA